MKPLLLGCCLILLIGTAQADSLYTRQVGYYQATFIVCDVAVKDGHAYVAAYDGLHVLSVADPTQPYEVSSVSLSDARGVAVAGDFTYVAGGYDSSLSLIYVADPAHPVVVGRCPTPDYAVKVAVRGRYAYVTTMSGFCVISVADPARPFQVGWLPAGYEYNLDVVGDYAYVADIGNGLCVISLADPSHPTEVGSVYCHPQGVAVNASLVYLGCNDSSFRVISVSDPANPVEVGRADSVLWANGTQSVGVTRGFAFVTNWTSGYQAAGLRVVSVADSTHPVEVAYYRLGGCWSTALNGRYFYVGSESGLYILQFYQLGDLDVDLDSLDMSADTLRLRRWAAAGESLESVRGEFILANTSASYNPDTTDGPSQSPVDSLTCTGSLAGPGGTIDSIVIPNLPSSLALGQTMVCTLAAYLPVGLRDGDYTGSIYISGKDTAGLLVQDSCYVAVRKLADLDVDNDSMDVAADAMWLHAPGSTGIALGEFVLANTSPSFNPDTADGPSRSPVDSLGFTGSLAGPGGTLDSILIPNLPHSLAQGQSVVCTLAVYLPPGLEGGDYTGVVTIVGRDTGGAPARVTFYALVRNTAVGDLDVDGDSLGVVRDTMNLHTQPAGPVYSPYAKTEFMLVNTSSAYNPDAEDGPSRSPLRAVKVEANVEAKGRSIDSVYVLNLPESLAVGQAVECTLALVIPVGESLDSYSGLVAIDAYDTAGYRVRDSFFLTVRGPEPRENLDSLRVAPIPFKPNQNPEHDAIHFQGLSAKARVTVYDASGLLVWSATENGDGHLAWKAEVASGIYVYLVVSADGKASKVGKLSVIR